jgi:hypothetical protein
MKEDKIHTFLQGSVVSSLLGSVIMEEDGSLGIEDSLADGSLWCIGIGG